MFQYVYSTLSPKYFCRIDDYAIRNKLAFEVDHAGYQNQKESLQLLHLQQQRQQQQQIVNIKQEQIDENETVEVKVINNKKKICRQFFLKQKKEKLLATQKKIF